MLVKEWEYNNFLKSAHNFSSIFVNGSDRGKVTDRTKEIINNIKLNINGDIDILDIASENFIDSKSYLYEVAYQKSMFSLFTIIRINLDLLKIEQEVEKFLINIDSEKSNLILLESNYLKTNASLLNLFKERKNFAPINCYLDTSKNITSTINKFAKKYALNLEISSLNYLSTRLGNDSMITENEIKKLALFANGNNLTLEDILNCVGDNSSLNLFNLCDAIGIENENKINYLYDRTIETGSNYIIVLRSIYKHLNLLLDSKNKSLKSTSEIKPSIHFSRAPQVDKQLQNLSIDKLKKYLVGINNLEVISKLNPNLSDLIIKKYLIQ